MDHKKARKLYLTRNHDRVVQSSMDLLQSWRANCDVQILIYEASPDDPSVLEIARVTDYIVAYSCKGNTTFIEELEQNKKLILACDELTSDKSDVVRVAKQVLNDSCKKRMISKQECMVILGGLDLVLCSETVENVSISSSKRLRRQCEPNTDKSFVTKYMNRPAEFEHMNMEMYFRQVKNTNPQEKFIIPNFVGIGGQATYPATENYARHVLTVYKPWRTYPRGLNWIVEFNNFMESPAAPMAAKLQYKRAMMRVIDKTKYCQPKADKMHVSFEDASVEDKQLLRMLGLKGSDDIDYDTKLLQSLDKGIDHVWDLPAKVSNDRFICIPFVLLA